MEDITTGILMDFITGRVMTTGCTSMKDIYHRSNMIGMHMKTGGAVDEIMLIDIKTGDINSGLNLLMSWCFCGLRLYHREATNSRVFRKR